MLHGGVGAGAAVRRTRPVPDLGDAEAPAECWKPHALEAVKLHGDGVVAKLAGIDDRDASEALGSCYIGAPREALPAPAEGEYYWADLAGLAS